MQSTFVLAAADGGFNLLDVGGAGNFIWTLVIFVIALPLMWKVVFGPITEALYDRDSKANEAIVAAQKASADAEQARAAVEVALGEAQAEAAKLMAGARERAEVRERDIVGNAKKEAEAMIEQARTAISAEKDKAISTIRQEVVDLSLAAASKVLGRTVGTEDDRRLVTDLVGGGGGDEG